MIANRVKETTTTTGASNLTLAGAATNFQSFNTAFGTSRRFNYWIIDDTNNVWETGIGYLSASTTLVRETVTDNSSGTTSALTLSAGTKTIHAAPSESSLPVNPTYLRSPKTVISAHWGGFDDTTAALIADRLYLQPFKFLAAGNIDAFRIIVDTAVASSKARVGLYEVNSSGEPGALMATTGDIDTTTTGSKTATFTAVHVRAGWYFVGLICSGAVVFAAIAPARSTESFLGRESTYGYFPVIQLYDDITAGWTTLPDPPTIDGMQGLYDSSVKIITARFA